ncbi:MULTISPECIES: hypothetical protein [Prochlorococcus]|uniref:hypothetical protein n=1 Tax=Prochlorococcus TaxID=1218 RepID=UPI000533A22A|nr:MULTISPECIES: hypothetical protein [Prochlorococcus]KGG12073.1 hypothetical protein EV05_1276 [Prochlorococcus sp. MIT 0601]
MNTLFNLKIAAITHYQSCTGSVFIHSLLDGHPQICTIPGVPNLIPLIHNEYQTAEEALNIFELHNPKFYDTSKMSLIDPNSSGLHNLGDNMNEGIKTNRNDFIFYYYQHILNENITPRNVILSLYYAYSCSHGRDILKDKVVLLHPHEPWITFEFLKIFPESKHLIPVRDPMRAYCSRIKLTKEKAYLRKQPYSPIDQLSSMANNLYDYCKLDMDMCVFKIEDFGSNRDPLLLKISKYLDIDFNISMTKSTFGSKIYWGANPSARTSVFDPSRHSRKVPLRRYEKNLFYALNGNINSIFSYSDKSFTKLEKIFSIFWLCLPMQEELHWLNQAIIKRRYAKSEFNTDKSFSVVKCSLLLLKERLFLFFIFFRNFRSSHYNKIRSVFINLDD